MATSLLDYLKENGYKADEKRNTLREYDTPTIEFYKSGQARLRGMGELVLDYLVYHCTDNGIELFICKDEEEMKSTAGAMNWRTCRTATGKAPNIRVGKPAEDFFEHIATITPDNCKETQAGAVAWGKATVEGKKILWEK